MMLGFLVYQLSKKIYNSFSNQKKTISKKRKAVYFISTILLLSFGIYNSITHYPLRWSEAFFSKKNEVIQFALNPVLYFFDSFAYRSEGLNTVTFYNYYPVIAAHLNLPKDRVSFERKVFFD
ncbi:hypothetical protein OAJ14_03620 [Polaribacter sp.]|nr:hypothetical protein [Polaribacter sp.]